MTSTATKKIIEQGIDGLADMISYGSTVPQDELHNRLYNEDYFIIGTYQAKQFLDEYGTFDAIGRVQDYEQDNFGEVHTDLTDPEKIANMLAYIEGEEALNQCQTYSLAENELSEDELIAIKKELGGQL